MSVSIGNGVAWPDHDHGATPPPEPQRNQRPVRKRMALWDRTKLLVLLGVVWLVFLWSLKSDNPIITWPDAVNETLRARWWILALAVVEALRQVHYLISERSAGYHGFWTERVFGSIERRTGRLNDWNRFRIARAFKYVVLLIALAVVLGAVFGEAPAVALFGLPARVLGALPDILRLVLYLAFAVGQFAAIFWFLSRGGMETYFPDDIKTRFSDVWGQDAVVERVKENTLFLENPEAIEEKGGYVPGGILLWGPPGTGKTLMAEAVAGETGKPYVFVDPGAFTNMFMGVGILKVKSLFRKLRKLAVRYGGVIVFFDEADALGNRGALAQGGWNGAMTGPSPWADRPSCNGMSYVRPSTASSLALDALPSAAAEPGTNGLRRIVMGGMGGGGGMGTLQALLTELSGLKKPRGFVNRYVRRALGMRPKPPPKYRMLVMMATNMPESLDEALLRPGRIDRIYRVGYPSKAGRKRTYEGYFAKVRHELTGADIDKLATMTPYATGATIKDLVNESLVVAIRDGREVITWQDVVKAKLLKDVGPPEDVEYIERERHAVAVHEACHAVAQYLLRKNTAIDVATIEKGQTTLGFVKPIPLEEQFTSWKSEYDAEIVVFIASLAGERLFFEGDNSSGVSGDLQSATNIAMRMEGFWGMGAHIGSHAATKSSGGQPVLDGTAQNVLETGLGDRVERRLQALYEHATQLVAEHRLTVLRVAHALEVYKTITGDDVVAVIEGKVGPLVDGRSYHTAEFSERVEHYHLRAVAAHQAYTKIDIPLPSLNGHQPDPMVDPLAVWAYEHPHS